MTLPAAREAPLSDAERRKNDNHRPLVVLAVLAVLCLYLYLFTQVATPLGIPLPKDLAAQFGIHVDHVFDSDRNVDSTVGVRLTRRLSSDEERLVLFLIITAAFLCAYFLPLPYKQPSLTAWTMLALALLYGLRATALLLVSHLVVYAILHPNKRSNLPVVALAGLLSYAAFFSDSPWNASGIALAAGAAVGAPVIYRYVVVPLLAVPRLAPLLRTATVQSAILTVCISAVIEGLQGAEWRLPLGLLLFFWQWERLIMYHMDYKDGLIPKDVTLSQYLVVFLNPGVIPNWNWGVTIGQGYAYTHQNFLCEDKNKLVLSGLKLLGIALFYLLFWNWLRHALVDLFNALGIPVYRAYTKDLIRHFARGHEISTPSVLFTTLLDLIRWTMLWAGVVHFKVGVWRICGYRIEPYIHRPWAATNLATLWSRITFHYRAFLVRAFYYPVYFRFFKKRPAMRVLFATLAAAGFGNLVWGHIPERMYYRGMAFENLLYVLSLWPYYLLLGLGIGLTHVYLLIWKRSRRRNGKTPRKPWTLDRWIAGDIVAVYCTLQFWALIRIFSRRPEDMSVWELGELFLIGFGIHISK